MFILPRQPHGHTCADEARGVKSLRSGIADVVQVLDVKVPGAACEIPVRVYQASADASSQLLVYFHGGGFVMGSIKSHDAVCRRLAKYSQVLRGIHDNFGC